MTRAEGGRPGPLDRLLRLFTDVRAGESGTALLLTLNVFLILTAYLILKVLREPLILTGGGAEIKSYSSAGQALLLLVIVPAYGALANRVPRQRLINIVTGIFVACLAFFYAAARFEMPFLGVVFFIWVGIFNVMIVAQFWSFANDVYTSDEGERLFPIVAFGASAGAVFGGWVAGRLIDPLGLYTLFAVAAGLLILSAVITSLVDRRERAREPEPDVMSSATMPAATSHYRAATGEYRTVTEEYLHESGTFSTLSTATAEPPDDRESVATEEDGAPTSGSFQLVFRSRYLLLIALLLLTLNWVNTTGEFILSSVVEDAAAEAAAGASGVSQQEYIGAFYSNFLTVVNLVGLLAQLFLVSRIIKYFGVRIGLLILPVIALGGYALLAFSPVIVLAAVRWVKTAENATDYSLQNTVRQALFLPTTREEKYKAKQAIDAFFWRAGDVLSAGLVFVGSVLLTFETRHFAMANLVLVVGWLVLAVFVGRRYDRLTSATER